MKEREYILSLYEVYKELLSDREKDYFENYYYEDYNLQEIADNYNVSKSYVGKYINEIEDKLKGYEKALKIAYKYSRIRELIDAQEDEVLKLKIEEIL
jgi:predicted DNA-binding protein YlxM (UPF0122 family)